MGNKHHFGEFEETVLLAVLNLRENAYGVPICQRVEEATGREISFGAIYVTLDRLEEKGYVSSSLGEKTAERGGRAKKYFKIEGAGLIALEEAERVRQHLRNGVTMPTGNLGLLPGV